MENPWQRLEREQIYADPFIKLYVDQVIRPDGQPGIHSLVMMKGGVGIVCVNDEEKIVLVGQYRYCVERYSWEIPKGGLPDFDYEGDLQKVAADELREETGVIARDWQKLGLVHTLLGSTDDEVQLFTAKFDHQVEPEPDPTEIIQVKWVTLEEFYLMVEAQKITDATSIAAVNLFEKETNIFLLEADEDFLSR